MATYSVAGVEWVEVRSLLLLTLEFIAKGKVDRLLCVWDEQVGFAPACLTARTCVRCIALCESLARRHSLRIVKEVFKEAIENCFNCFVSTIQIHRSEINPTTHVNTKKPS